jgi:hypothetical protein
MGRKGVAHLPFVVRGSRRAPSGTRGREIGKLKGREGLRQGSAIIVRSGDQALEYLHLFGIVGSWFLFPGIADRTSGLERQHGGTRALDHWERGEGASLSSHLTFLLESPKQGYAKQPCLKIPIALGMFSQKKNRNRGFAGEEPGLTTVCERGQWGTGVFCLWGT